MLSWSKPTSWIVNIAHWQLLTDLGVVVIEVSVCWNYPRDLKVIRSSTITLTFDFVSPCLPLFWQFLVCFCFSHHGFVFVFHTMCCLSCALNSAHHLLWSTALSVSFPASFIFVFLILLAYSVFTLIFFMRMCKHYPFWFSLSVFFCVLSDLVFLC